MKIFVHLVFILLATQAKSSEISAPSYRPPAGYVADEQTASAVSEAILIPIYGKENIQKQKPFRVTRRGDAWVVVGDPARNRPHYVGGNFTIHISKNTGEILYLNHTK